MLKFFAFVAWFDYNHIHRLELIRGNLLPFGVSIDIHIVRCQRHRPEAHECFDPLDGDGEGREEEHYDDHYTEGAVIVQHPTIRHSFTIGRLRTAGKTRKGS